MSLTRRTWREIHSISRTKLGHDDLRPGQARALQAVLEGRDTLVIMPTGAGKSAIYQIAALMLPGPTVVVSPLISLQRDQLEAIAESELAPAAVVNSTLSASERKHAFEQLEGDLEFILWRRSSSRTRIRWSASALPGHRCSWSTRPTASASGGTASGPITSASAP
jgi:superfamily II DNA helicase RecQ